MASIRKEISIDARPDDVWAAIRDVGAIHQRLAPGFVTDTRMEGEAARVVTFANGFVVRELIVDVDDERRRLAYAAVGGRSTHHNASFEVFADGPEGTRLVWIADVLPHEVAAPIGDMMEQGARVMQRALERCTVRG
jgi:carbon monoxide dehydrogenase subunit G